MKRYIMDDKVILSLQGLRSVKKCDQIHSSNISNTYGITWNYKGSDGYMNYQTIEQRNKIFNEIKEEIKELRNEEKQRRTKK